MLPKRFKEVAFITISQHICYDSLIDNVEVQDNGTRVVLVIDFAFWMQEGCKESDPETGLIKVVFNNVSYHSIPKGADWNEISILETRLESGQVKFALMNDRTDDYLEIIIASNSVDVEVE